MKKLMSILLLQITAIFLLVLPAEADPAACPECDASSDPGLKLANSTRTLTPPYQLMKVGSGYEVKGLPPELMDDLFKLHPEEQLTLSLVDPRYGNSRVEGHVQVIDGSTVVFATNESFVYHPDLNRTYLVFELADRPKAGGSCSGCTLTNRNLKARTPQICWCFSKDVVSNGKNPACEGVADSIGFPTPHQSTLKLKALIDNPSTDGSYTECYPASGVDNCLDFILDCKVADGDASSSPGGVSSLPGGGYGCDIR